MWNQALWKLGDRAKERREDAAIGSNDGFWFIHHVIGDRTVIGVNNDLDRIAKVVDPCTEGLAVGIAVGVRIGIHDPIELAVSAHDDVDPDRRSGMAPAAIAL